MNVGAIAGALVVGLAIGRVLPRRGRHAKPLTRRGREKIEAMSRARQSHPTESANSVIDLRAWVPTDEQLAARIKPTRG
jgi:hypothetical protein